MNTAIQTAFFSTDQVSLIKRTICQGATDDELAIFLYQCERTRLDPFSRQIHAVKRKSKHGPDTLTIQVGIDGFRLIAERTKELDGQDGPYWCGADGQWLDVWLPEANPIAAKVLVYRKGCSRPFVGVAHWNEYYQDYYDQHSRSWKLTKFWQDMPALMLAKCAEALALRKAFPQELSGLYISEEIRDRGDEPRVVEALPAPARVAAVTPPAGEEIAKRVKTFEAVMVSKGLCKPGELHKHVMTTLGGEFAGPMGIWPAEATDAVARVCKEYHAERKATPQVEYADSAMLDQIDTELNRVGLGWLEFLEKTNQIAIYNVKLTKAQAEEVLDTLGEMADYQE